MTKSSFFFAMLFFTLLMAVANFTIDIMASPYIVGDLGGSNDIAVYAVTFYSLGNAIGVPLGWALMKRIGTSRFLVGSLLLFTFFSWMCAIVPNYPIFNAMRFLQGFAAGPLYLLNFHLSSCLAPKDKRNLFTAILLSIFTMSPVIGACWGGWIAYDGNWRWIFYLDIPIALFLAAYFWISLRGFEKKEKDETRFDGVGYFFFCLGLLCLGLVVLLGQQLDWFRSYTIIALTVISSISLLYFVFYELNHPHPIVNVHMFKNPFISFALLNLSILFSAYFGMILLLALWLKLWVSWTPNWISLLLGVMLISGIFPFLFVTEKIRKMDNRIFLAFSIVFLAISCFYTMYFNVEINFGRIAISRIFAGFGLAFFLVPILRICFLHCPEEKHPEALTLFQIVRALSSGLGGSIFTTIWLRRQVFYHERLGSRLTDFSAETQEFYTKAAEVQLFDGAANAQLEYYLQREATSLALDDCFWLMGWILVGLLATYLFTLRARKNAYIAD